MPVELTIVETTVELGVTNVDVILESTSAPGPAGPGVPSGGTDGQVLTKQSASDFDTDWETPSGGPGGGAPTDADYLVGTANGTLSAEIVVGTAPGGELGGTWATPTVDTTHSGSSHASVQAAAEATAAAALTTHTADTTAVHGIADTSALALTANHPSNATFNDHSARHENGGADEISIAGLDGTSTDLAAHLADASDAHDASAISFVPDGSIAATNVQAAIVEVRDEAAGGGAPSTADFLVGTAQGGLSAEIVVGTSPGGELGGTWASPTVDATHSGSSHADVQAAAEATAAAALSAHLSDASDAHDASAISIVDAGNDFAATDVEGALAELQADHEATVTAVSDHISDSSAAHAASAISVVSTTLSGTGTDVQAVFEEIDNLLDDHSARHENGGADEISLAGLDGTPVELTNHLNDASDAHDASAISVVSTTLSGTGTDVQAVFEEIDNLLDDHSARHEDGGADEISIQGLAGTPVELTNHLSDASDAHDASAISLADAGSNYAAGDVEAALAEIADRLEGASVQVIIDGAGSTITTGVKGYVEIPFSCVITAVRLLADQSGSIVVDIWKDTYANYPPVNADSITASATPTISSAVKSEDATLTGWTTSVTAGDILGFNVDSATSITRLTVALTVRR